MPTCIYWNNMYWSLQTGHQGPLPAAWLCGGGWAAVPPSPQTSSGGCWEPKGLAAAIQAVLPPRDHPSHGTEAGMENVLQVWGATPLACIEHPSLPQGIASVPALAGQLGGHRELPGRAWTRSQLLGNGVSGQKVTDILCKAHVTSCDFIWTLYLRWKLLLLLVLFP